MKSEQELKDVALALYKEKIFTDRHIDPGQKQDLIGTIFLPLIFLPEKMAEEWEKEPPGLIYEYYDKCQTTRAINGYPIFHSFRTLTQEETKLMLEQYNEIKEVLKEFEPKERSKDREVKIK